MGEMLTRDAEHHYFWKGQRVPGVSEVLAPYSEFAKFAVDDERMEQYRERGRAVHSLCELFDRGRLNHAELDDIGKLYVTQWQLFLREVGFTPVLIEHMAYSKSFGFAGQLDRYGVRTVKGKEKKMLVDIKSGVPGRTTGQQTAAYSQLVREDFGENVDERWAVHLTPKFYKIVPYDKAADFKIFASALVIHNWHYKEQQNERTSNERPEHTHSVGTGISPGSHHQ